MMGKKIATLAYESGDMTPAVGLVENETT